MGHIVRAGGQAGQAHPARLRRGDHHPGSDRRRDPCGRELPWHYKEYAGAGHGLFLTHAEQINQDLLDFIGDAV
ncbi:hypothetical protein GCM10010129_43130 [Streptomyces fumigatiscleroticus]|nr:hypothetical protein GCM10010129_43130 [Streptomyces fumigatiscleroticus]